MENSKPGNIASFLLFAAKTAAVLILVVFFLDAVLPDFGEIKTGLQEDLAQVRKKLDKNFKSDRTKLYILSFVQNPAALYKVSEIEEREGKLESAVRDMELAIGLLEMHGADKQVIKRYYSRLEKLRAGATAGK